MLCHFYECPMLLVVLNHTEPACPLIWLGARVIPRVYCLCVLFYSYIYVIPVLHQGSLSLFLFSSYIYVIPVFVWVLTFLIVFALQLVQPLVSVLTFFKGSLLLGTVSQYDYISIFFTSIH